VVPENCLAGTSYNIYTDGQLTRPGTICACGEDGAWWLELTVVHTALQLHDWTKHHSVIDFAPLLPEMDCGKIVGRLWEDEGVMRDH
jgi:hypothetical protein